MSDKTPEDLAACIQEHPDGSVLRVHAQPGARREAPVGLHGDALKCAVRAAPEKGKANAGLRKLLAEALDVPPRDIELLSGSTQRAKRFLLRGCRPGTAAERLATALRGC